MSKDLYQTQLFRNDKNDADIKEIIRDVYEALDERDYDPVNQLVGYILSGDPTYITSHKDARKKIRQVDRDEILEEILRSYIDEYNLSNE